MEGMGTRREEEREEGWKRRDRGESGEGDGDDEERRNKQERQGRRRGKPFIAWCKRVISLPGRMEVKGGSSSGLEALKDSEYRWESM